MISLFKTKGGSKSVPFINKENNMKIKLYIAALLIFSGLTSCHNDKAEFDDYQFQTVYFAYQYPVRTITFGEDIFDTTLDNQGKTKIMATIGGTYHNDRDVRINFQVDNTITENLLFEQGGEKILPMPENYYTLNSNEIKIPKGEIAGGVEVQFSDAFFADPLATSRNYVIPLQMTNVVNADSVLSGRPLAANPRKAVADDWDVLPKDYILYAVKYINTWEGNYLRRGVDVIKGTPGNESLDDTVVRHQQYVEDDQVIGLSTRSLTETSLDLTFQNSEGYAVNCTLILSFDDAGNCTISAGSDQYTASGSGKFVKDGEKESWGGEDRDALYLEYQVNMDEISVSTTDTLVLRDRGVAMETFSPVVE